MVCRRIRLFFLMVAVTGAARTATAQDETVLYHNDFEHQTSSRLPEEFLILQGDFSMRTEDGNRFLHLPGAPLESFAVMFGPRKSDGWAASARIFGTPRGRRYPTFGIGLNGVGGFQLRVSPAKQIVELFKRNTVVASAPFQWKGRTWTSVKLQVTRQPPDRWRITGKVWAAADPEPEDWIVQFDDSVKPLAGRVTVSGSPYAGTPIYFDDLLVTEPGDAPVQGGQQDTTSP